MTVDGEEYTILPKRGDFSDVSPGLQARDVADLYSTGHRFVDRRKTARFILHLLTEAGVDLDNPLPKPLFSTLWGISGDKRTQNSKTKSLGLHCET